MYFLRDKIFTCGLIFLIVFSCLAYGSLTTLPLTIIEIAASIMVLFWLLDMVNKKTVSFVRTGFSWLLALFLGLVIVQIIPLPLGIVRILSGNAAGLYKKFLPLDSGRVIFSLSIYPYATISELLKVLTYLGVFFLVINRFQKKSDCDLIFNAIVTFGVLISIFGIIQKYTYSGKVYWFDSPGSAAAPFGPFINRNNFAGYINMVMPLALGYFLAVDTLAKKIIYGFAIVVLSSALFLSMSRAGIFVYVVVLLFILLLSSIRYSLRAKRETLLVIFFLVFLSCVLFVDIKSVWERFGTLFSPQASVVFGHGYSWWDIFRIWQDFPFFGIGLGTFASISAMYKSTTSQALFTYAHNDYLQLLAETGLLCFIFISLFFIFYFKVVFNAWRRRHNSYVVYLSLGGIGSLLGALVYSLLDFNLHIPANALLFFIILGMVYRLVHMDIKDDG